MPEFAGTFWALLPPVIAIALALLTKEVYVSLLIGILSAHCCITSSTFIDALETTFTIMSDKVGSNTNHRFSWCCWACWFRS